MSVLLFATFYLTIFSINMSKSQLSITTDRPISRAAHGNGRDWEYHKSFPSIFSTNLDSEFSGVIANAEYSHGGRVESRRREAIKHLTIGSFICVMSFQSDDDGAWRSILHHVYFERWTTHEHRLVVVRVDHVDDDRCGASLRVRSAVDGDECHPMLDLRLAVKLFFQYQLHLYQIRRTDTI